MKRLLLLLITTAWMTAPAAAEIAPRAPEQIEAAATVILDGTIESIGGVRNRSITWDQRNWKHRLRVEEVLRGEEIEVGDLVEIESWSSFYRLPFFVPAYGTGHRPLPLIGERCRIHASITRDGRIVPILPNGWSLPANANASDPERFSPNHLQDPSAARGWLILAFGLGSTALSVRRKGKMKIVLLALGAVMLAYGVWMTV